MACMKCCKSCDTNYHSIEYNHQGGRCIAIYCSECVNGINIINTAGCVHCGPNGY